MAVFTTRNVRRAAHLWSWVALLGGPLVLLMGVLLVAGAGPGAPRPVEMWRTGASGEPLELLPSGRDAAVWGRPDGDGAVCTTARSSGAVVAELTTGPADARPSQVDDAGGTGRWTLIGVTAGTGAAATVTCSGPGLSQVAVSADPSIAGTPSFGTALLVVGPALVLLGWATRRALRGGTRTGGAPGGD